MLILKEKKNVQLLHSVYCFCLGLDDQSISAITKHKKMQVIGYKKIMRLTILWRPWYNTIFGLAHLGTSIISSGIKKDFDLGFFLASFILRK